MRVAAAAVIAVLLGLSAHAAATPAGGPQEPPSFACASGYHADAGGNCQPNVAQASRYCPPNTVFEPTFDGWRCDPPPPEAY